MSKLIDPVRDELLSGVLEHVATVAKRRTGHKPSPPTIWRWCRKGLKGGIRLQCVYHGGCWQTTDAAFDQFIAAQTAAAFASDGEEHSDDTSDADLIAAGLL